MEKKVLMSKVENECILTEMEKINVMGGDTPPLDPSPDEICHDNLNCEANFPCSENQECTGNQSCTGHGVCYDKIICA